MGYLSWPGRKARTSRIVRLAVVLLTALALPAVTAAASAQAAPSHPAASHAHLVVSRQAAADITEPCNPFPAGTFCVGSDYYLSNGYIHCSGTINYITTADFHSKWLRFEQDAGVPDHPECVENPTNSSVWVEDEQIESSLCAQPGTAIATSGHDQFGWFFVRYNISTCGSEPSPEPDGAT
jgi:hypothetical protein